MAKKKVHGKSSQSGKTTEAQAAPVAPTKEAAKKDDPKPKKTARVWPRFSGMCDFKAKKGKVLPVMVGPKMLLRITEKKWASISTDTISYSSKNILKRALMDGDIECPPNTLKGGR